MNPDAIPILKTAVQLLILLTIITTLIYTLVVGYHWFSYGSSRKTSTTALIIFIIGALCSTCGMVLGYALMF